MSDGGDYGHGRDPGSQGGAGRLTTRTRLPGSEGGGRPPSRPGRSLVTVVGVVVLLIAAIAFANRGDDGGDPRADEGRNGGAQSQPTAPSGKKPVDSAKTPATGFPHTRQGAESAAANFAVALVSADIIKPGKRDELIQQIFAPGKVAEMRTKMDKAYSPKFLDNLGLDENGEAKNGMTYVSRTSPVGTKTRAYSGSKAKLDVWCTGVFGTAGDKSTNPVTSDWFTLQLDLRWEDGDWKVQSFAQKEGPAPVNGDNRASGADEIADAVDEYGGFTYAR
ncbi:hypothetical protein [Streptomyces iconiensis]|uniref:DUF8175 domain-containing protein n=1 Tax=Streptomyces iconiensis TaxID=1384038 RepID=A0ABT7AAJ0_9ACTN|nr:hypothetical protein [Streptomyces iconiensis]MDJ1138352.1 hypothetical protein [Streptomyces iconiensis]